MWWAKFELECLLYWYYSRSKSHLQNRGLWMPVHQNPYRKNVHFGENCLNFLTFHLPICSFYHKNTLNWHLWVLWNLLLLTNPSVAFQDGSLSCKELKSRVSQSKVCNLHITHSSALKIQDCIYFADRPLKNVQVVLFNIPHNITGMTGSLRMWAFVTCQKFKVRLNFHLYWTIILMHKYHLMVEKHTILHISFWKPLKSYNRL